LVRQNRRPAAADNPFIGAQQTMSDQIIRMLDAWRDARDSWAERTFFTVYGSPALQAAAGIDPADSRPLRKAAKSRLHRELLLARISELKSLIPHGGLRAAVVRALIYVGMARGAVDERAFELLRQIRRSHGDIPLSEFKALVREQFLILLIDQEAAVEALPAMLPREPEVRQKAIELVTQVLSVRGEISGALAERLERVKRLFNTEQAASEPATVLPLPRQIAS